MNGIIVDNFAGGGGASIGISLALGRPVDVAINHDPIAIAMHRVNHPDTKHYIENVWDVDPRQVVREHGNRLVDLCWFSPDCKHFSKAKGGKPVDKNIRSLAWVAVRWAATVKPRVIILENVEEFKTWGPLLENGQPCPKKRGKTFKAFVNALKRQGYRVDWRELRACDYGAPTIRKRLFLIARRDSWPIVWPEATHGEPGRIEVVTGVKKPWRAAAEIIDWSLPCPSIFESAKEIKAKYGLRAVRPLSDNTMRRIARGIQKFVIDNPQPFIVRVNHGGDSYRGQDINSPLMTVTAKHGYGIVAPFFTQYHSDDSVRGQTIDKPLLTQDTSNRYGLVTSHLIKMKGTNIGQPVTEPIQTVTAGGLHFGEVRGFLMKYYGNGEGQELSKPLHTVVSRDKYGLVTVYGQDYRIADIGLRMLQPHELFAAQGFPAGYIIDRDENGKKFTKSEQVAKCGNAVPPPIAEALVRVNLQNRLRCVSSCNRVYQSGDGQRKPRCQSGSGLLPNIKFK